MLRSPTGDGQRVLRSARVPVSSVLSWRCVGTPMSDQDDPYRIFREKRLRAAYSGGLEVELPPPYLTQSVDMLYILCGFDQAEARAVLPAELELSEPAQGVIGLVHASSGGALAPFTCGFATLQVKGHNTPDGWPANYLHTGFYSGVAGRVMHTLFNENVTEDGNADLRSNGEDFVAIARGKDGPAIRISGTRTNRVGPPVAGLNHYLGHHSGRITSYFTSYSAHFRDTENVSVDILDTAPPLLRRLKPTRVVWPLSLEGMALTISPPTILSTGEDLIAANAARRALLDIFSRLRWPAAIVGKGRGIIRLNREAQALAGDGFTIRADCLFATQPECQAPLDRAIAAALSSRNALADPVMLARSRVPAPLVAQAMPAGPMGAHEPSALVLFVDPVTPARRNTAGALEMMGLTPAEARIAALVGAGVSPKVAAARLEITEQTARSALKVVYEKLSISKQIELGKMVGRLDSLGGLIPS